MTFVKGDFNYDGNVDFNDLAMLAQRYNTTLSPPPAPAPALSPTASKSPGTARLFNSVVPVRAPAPTTRAAQKAAEMRVI
jgi:hypothetical protein